MSDSDIQSRIIQQVQKVRIPTPTDRVYKDDCIFCFDTPVCRNIYYLYVNRYLKGHMIKPEILPALCNVYFVKLPIRIACFIFYDIIF